MVHLRLRVLLRKGWNQIRVAASLIEVFRRRGNDSIRVISHFPPKLWVIYWCFLILFGFAYISDRTSLKILVSQDAVHVFKFIEVCGIAGPQSNCDSTTASCPIFQKSGLFNLFVIGLPMCSAFARGCIGYNVGSSCSDGREKHVSASHILVNPMIKCHSLSGPYALRGSGPVEIELIWARCLVRYFSWESVLGLL